MMPDNNSPTKNKSDQKRFMNFNDPTEYWVPTLDRCFHY